MLKVVEVRSFGYSTMIIYAQDNSDDVSSLVLANSSDALVADLSLHCAVEVPGIKMMAGGQKDSKRAAETSFHASGSSSSWSKSDASMASGRSSCSSSDESEADIEINSSKKQNNDRSASVIAQQALKALDALFVDLDLKQPNDYSSQPSESGELEGANISLGELTIALNAAIDRYRPVSDRMNAPRRSRHKKRQSGSCRHLAIERDEAQPLPADVLVPLTHFQDALEKKSKSFQEYKQRYTKNTSPKGREMGPMDSQYRCPSQVQPSSSAYSLSRFDLSTALSVCSVSDFNVDSPSNSDHRFVLDAGEAVSRRVDTQDQQEQTTPIPKIDRWTETLEIGDPSPARCENSRPMSAMQHTDFAVDLQSAPSIGSVASTHNKRVNRRVSGLSLVSWRPRSSLSSEELMSSQGSNRSSYASSTRRSNKSAATSVEEVSAFVKTN